MRLAIVTHDPDATAETYVRHHIRSLSPECCVIYHHGEGRSISDLPNYKLPMASGPISWLNKLWGLLRYGYSATPIGAERKALVDFLRGNKVQLVYAEFGPNGSLMWSICEELGMPLVVNFHGYDATVMPQHWRTRRAYRFWRNKVNAMVCGSEHFKGVVASLGFDVNKIHVIPCGIDSTEFRPGQTQVGNRIAAVGRLTPKKAPQHSITAFAKVLRSIPDLQLDVVGDGPMRGSCEKLVSELGIQDNVHLHGALAHSEVKQILSNAHLFIQHSVIGPNGDTESQGISLIEAMASGLPVVCTDHNGFKETNIHGSTGFLVPEHDVNGMAQRIEELMSDPELHSRMSHAARERAVNNYDHALIDVRLSDLLQNLIEKNERP